MTYLRLLTLVSSMLTLSASSYASDAEEAQQTLPVQLSMKSITNISDLKMLVDVDQVCQSNQKKSKNDSENALYLQQEMNTSQNLDLTGVLFIMDFDECLGFLTTNTIGPEFEMACRLYSREIFRADKQAFCRAAEILSMTRDDMAAVIKKWESEIIGSRYALLEKDMPDLFLNLRKRGATFLVCSGNPCDRGRFDLMQTLGYNSKCEYLHDRQDKTRPIKQYLSTSEKSFSKIVFVDNYGENVKDILKGLANINGQIPSKGSICEIIGVHYKYFHATLDPETLVSQFETLKKWVNERK